MVRIQRYFPPSNPIAITTDSESDEEEPVIINNAQSRVAKHLRARQRPNVRPRVPVININEAVDGDEPDDAIVDLTGESVPPHNQDGTEINLHTISYISPRVGDLHLLEHSIRNGDIIRAGDVIELSSPISKFNVTHLVVHSIVIPQMGPGLFVGIPLGRHREIEHWLLHKPNETCLIFEANDNDNRPIEQQALIEVKTSQALRRKSVIFTNAIYPQHRRTIAQRGALACRWTCVLKYANDTKRREGKPRESVVQHIREPQVSSPDFSISSVQQRKDWRGTTVRGGSHIPPVTRNGIEIITLDIPLDDFVAEADTQQMDAKPGQQYTFGDMFCGAGGTSCGAQQAGFKINLACDADAMACATWRKNYRDARLWETTITDVINCTETLRVDVLHLSPPCQFFSPAHTRPGANDEVNTAALLGCGDLINKIRPRIFTLEQTFGITHEAHKDYMDFLIRALTSRGYSVRWQVVQLLQWGTAVHRKRLIVIGACPGERLPPFPRPTHAECPRPNSGLSPYTTVAQVLGHPPRSSVFDPHHQPAAMPRRSSMPWNADKPLPTTITTSGCDQKYKRHFDGQRDFTPREVAVLQGFPWKYQFSDKGVKKQAGNAFPPPAVKTLYSHLREWLLEVDHVKPATFESAIAAAAQQERGVIHIDDNVERSTIVISEEHDVEMVVTISDTDSEEDDFVMLDDERVFTAPPSRESTVTLDGQEVNEGVCRVEDLDVVIMEGGSEGAMRAYC